MNAKKQRERRKRKLFLMLFLSLAIPQEMFRLLSRPQQVFKTQLLTIPQYYSTKPTPPLPKINNKKNTAKKEKRKATIQLGQEVPLDLYRQSILQNDKKKNPDDLPEYIKRKRTLQKKHGNTPWNPKRRLSREDMDKLRQLKEIFPNYKTIDLSKIFRISPEAVRRILKSKFEKE